MIGESNSIQFSVLLERVYSTDLGKHVEAGTILFPLAIVTASQQFLIVNERFWLSQSISRFNMKNFDVLTFPFNILVTATKPLVRSLGPKFSPENPLTTEEIKVFKLLYED